MAFKWPFECLEMVFSPFTELIKRKITYFEYDFQFDGFKFVIDNISHFAYEC